MHTGPSSQARERTQERQDSDTATVGLGRRQWVLILGASSGIAEWWESMLHLPGGPGAGAGLWVGDSKAPHAPGSRNVVGIVWA